MYRHIQDLKITKTTIYIKTENVDRTIPNPIDIKDWRNDELGCKDYYFSNGSMILTTDKLDIWFDDGKTVNIPLNRVIRYRISKDIQKKEDGFNLNYRKNIRWEFSKDHMDVIYLPESFTIRDDIDVQNFIKSASRFSDGIHNKPLVIVGSKTVEIYRNRKNEDIECLDRYTAYA